MFANLDWNFIGKLFLYSLPALSVLIVLINKFFPKSRKYFDIAYSAIKIINSVIDEMLKAFHENEQLNNVNNIVDKIIEEFEQAGYELDDNDKEEVKELVVDNLKTKEGLTIDKDGKISIGFTKKF